MIGAYDTTPLGEALATTSPACAECGDRRTVVMTNGRDVFLEPCPNCGAR